MVSNYGAGLPQNQNPPGWPAYAQMNAPMPNSYATSGAATNGSSDNLLPMKTSLSADNFTPTSASPYAQGYSSGAYNPYSNWLDPYLQGQVPMPYPGINPGYGWNQPPMTAPGYPPVTQPVPKQSTSTLPLLTDPKDPSKPDLKMTKFDQLNMDNIQSLGNIKVVLFDVDDTLRKYNFGHSAGKVPEALGKQIKALQDSGIQVGIVSNNHSKKAVKGIQKQLQKFGVEAPAVYHAKKPGAEGMQEMQKHLEMNGQVVPSDRIVMVGDQQTDVEAAHKAGFKAIQVDWYGESEQHKENMEHLDDAGKVLDKFDSDDKPIYIDPPKEEAKQSRIQAAPAA